MNPQRGVAIISVLLTVALASIIVSGLFLREHITVRSVENRVALTQARWIERAAIDWSKVILAADAKGTKEDHLGEPWAIPVLDTRLDETVTAGAKIDDDARAATLSGQMIDAQSRFNLNNLISVDANSGAVAPSEENRQVFGRLLSVLGLSEALADSVTAQIMASQPGGGDDDEPVAVLPMLRLTDLQIVRGVNTDAIELLEDFVIFLPSHTSKINVNTAPAEVLAAVVEGLSLEAARQIVTKRERIYFREVKEFLKEAPETTEPKIKDLLDVKSTWFLVRGLIRFGRVESFTETLLRRDSSKVDVIWQRRL